MNKIKHDAIEKLAIEKYGLCNFVSYRENFEDLQNYADSYSKEQKTIAHLFIMMTFNTQAFMKAQKEYEENNE